MCDNSGDCVLMCSLIMWNCYFKFNYTVFCSFTNVTCCCYFGSQRGSVQSVYDDSARCFVGCLCYFADGANWWCIGSLGTNSENTGIKTQTTVWPLLTISDYLILLTLMTSSNPSPLQGDWLLMGTSIRYQEPKWQWQNWINLYNEWIYV